MPNLLRLDCKLNGLVILTVRITLLGQANVLDGKRVVIDTICVIIEQTGDKVSAL